MKPDELPTQKYYQCGCPIKQIRDHWILTNGRLGIRIVQCNVCKRLLAIDTIQPEIPKIIPPGNRRVF